jgi:hypothetical protein
VKARFSPTSSGLGLKLPEPGIHCRDEVHQEQPLSFKSTVPGRRETKSGVYGDFDLRQFHQ